MAARCRKNLAQQFTDPSARLNVEADLELIDHFDEQLRRVELQLSRTAKVEAFNGIVGSPLDGTSQDSTMGLDEIRRQQMERIVVQADIAEQIRRSDGQVELVDDQGNTVGVVRRPPTEDEIQFAKARADSKGPKLTIDELIEKVEAL